MNQAARTTLLVIMPTLDDFDIATVQRATSLVVWSSPGLAVRVAPLVVTVVVAAHQQVVEVVLGLPTPYALGDISMGEAVSMAHQALSQAQRVLHCEGEELPDER
jgi:hypothetical protein